MRRQSEVLIAGLEPEDLGLQGMAHASPPKWHLGHTAWFFEEFLLRPALERPDGCLAYEPADPRWRYLFNSYYDAVGARHPQPQRGQLSRPPIAAVLAWRERIGSGLDQLLASLDEQPPASAASSLALLELGLQHEQQHQELLQMDLLDGFSRNPLEPAYHEGPAGPEAAYERGWSRGHGANDGMGRQDAGGEPGWLAHPGGLAMLGHPGSSGGGTPAPLNPFHFDNEAPRHQIWLEPFALAKQLVTNAAYAAFIGDGGYRRPELWMSEGWAVRQQRGWQAPRYWRGADEFTLAGRRQRQPLAPVRHLSWFEADAFARWAGARLPSEAEWELLAAAAALPQAHGLLWQWTGTPTAPIRASEAPQGRWANTTASS